MRNTLLLPVYLLASTGFAQLAPQTEAPLFRHMAEINTQWHHMAPDLADGARKVHFATDAERIAEHLHLVAHDLRTRKPAGMTTMALARRTALLYQLDAYADRGIFPQNHVLPYRNPVFIDPYGTACAVGQLMIESGHRDLAERIDSEQELAYVEELLRSPDLATSITDWASTYGFTPDELAWIQPAYGPPPGWTELGGGTNGNVTTLLALNNGDLLVAGTFSQAGGQDLKHVARWNGGGYQAMGNGLNGRPECAIEYAGRIIVGGSFQGGLRDLAVWNGTTWQYTSAFPGMNPVVLALHVHNGRLHAAGNSSGFAGTDQEVRQFASGTWVPVGQKLNAPVRAMATYKGALTIGGDFTGTALFGPVDNSIQHVGQLVNGAWQQLADGLDAPVFDLELMGGVLYAGGDVYDANGNPVFGFARQPLYTNTWELLVGTNGPLEPAQGYTRILSLHNVQNTSMYLGGRFGFSSGAVHGRNLAVFYSTPTGDYLGSSAHVNKEVMDISTHGGEVVFGGAFTHQTIYDMIFQPYISPLNHVAIWSDGGWWTERSSLATGLEFGLAPNPATESLTITYVPEAQGDLVVRDATGRIVLHEAFGSNAQRVLDVSALAPGLYSVVITEGGNFGTKTFVKQ